MFVGIFQPHGLRGGTGGVSGVVGGGFEFIEYFFFVFVLDHLVEVVDDLAGVEVLIGKCFL